MNLQINKIAFSNVGRLVVGLDSLNDFQFDFVALNKKNLFLLTLPQVMPMLQSMIGGLTGSGIKVKINDQLLAEPSFDDIDRLLEEARLFQADSVVAIGGGSVMDSAKLLAALLDCYDDPRSFAGIGKITGRSTYLACIPTTSGTGSEVSPNAIFLDTADCSKKGVISPYLVPDAAYIDPRLTVGLPGQVTAATGIDAFTHCLEAYVNNFAHPITDLLALEGMKLIVENLKKAVVNGGDTDARSALAVGSLYGGLCLGPVNTGAIHALSYPLGSRYKVPHGLANALMLPYVVKFNTPAAVEKYARVAFLFGIRQYNSPDELSLLLSEALIDWVSDCGLPVSLGSAGIAASEIETLADEALKVQRLLKNNVRAITVGDAREIYKDAVHGKN